MLRALALSLIVVVVACNGDKKKAAPVGPTAAGDAVASGTAAPAEPQCLWLNICDQWAGCAHIAGGKVISAERLAPGDPVDVLDMCSGEPVCIAARGVPAGVVCPPHSTMIFIPEPDYTCAWSGSACVSQPKAKP